MSMNEVLQQVMNEALGAGENKQFVRLPQKRHKNALMAIPDFIKQTLLEVEAPEEGEWYDFFDMTNFTYDSVGREIYINAFVTLESPSPSMSIEGTIIDSGKDEVLYELTPVTVKNQTYLSLSQHLSGKTVEREQDVYAVLTARYHDEKAGDQEIHLVENLKGHVKDYIEEYVHQMPKKEPVCVYIKNLSTADASIVREIARKSVKDNEHIVISLIREPEQSGDCDYVCDFGRRPTPQQSDAPRLGIPFKASMTLKDNCTFAGDISTRCFLIRKGESGGAVRMKYMDSFQNKFHCDGKTSVDMYMDAWSIPYEEPGGLIKVEYAFQQDLLMKVKVGSVSVPLTATITTDPEDERAIYNKVLPILLMWGCLEEDAQISMADGRICAIRKIRVGEMVKGADGDKHLVRNIWKGRECDPCLRLFLVNGANLLMTKDHPVLTERGYCKASNLLSNDRIRVADGSYVELRKCVEENYDHMVYNLSLEEGSGGKKAGMIANGIAVGDYEIQNELA